MTDRVPLLLILCLLILSLQAAGRFPTPDVLPNEPLTIPIRINLPEAAVTNGAVCLDGTPATYYYYPGSGDGSNNWIVYHQGGGWCYDAKSCIARASTPLGSTAMEEADNSVLFTGMMSQNPASNPDFYNWNLVYMRYCDGASFSGDADDPLEVSPGGAKIFFRGQRIWEAMIADLMVNRGMDLAEKALLAGCSAGGLATMIHCDQFKGVMPNTTSIKCLSDAGFFLDQRNVEGEFFLRDQFASTVSLQNVTGSLHPDCTSGREASQMWQCFFPEYFIQFVKTPVYVLNSAYDSWQIENSLIPISDWENTNGPWKDCYSSFNFSSCSTDQLTLILGFWEHMTSSIYTTMNLVLENGGAFIFSCRIHCIGQRWTGGIQVNNVTPAKAFGDWYFGRNGISRLQIDRALPTNSSCLV